MNPPPVRLYNTFTRRKEALRPLQQQGDGKVRIYSCGPTVYRFAHVGNLRTFMVPDLLRRTLEYLGYEVEQVMNITDVGHLTDDTFERGEDKMLVAARLERSETQTAELQSHFHLVCRPPLEKKKKKRALHKPPE